MNLRTAQTGTSAKNKRRTVRRKRDRRVSFGFLFKALLPIAVMFMLTCGINSLNSEAERLNRRIEKLKIRIHSFDREIADLKIKREKLTGKFIIKQIARFKLDLHSPSPGQVKKLPSRRRFVRRAESRVASVPEPMLLSQR